MSPQSSAKSDLASATGAAVGLGGAVTAAAISACCAGPALGPLVVSLLGASGAVALEGLRPYTAALLVLSGLAIGASFWLTRRRGSCAADRGRMLRHYASGTLFWVAAVVWLVAVAAVAWARFA